MQQDGWAAFCDQLKAAGRHVLDPIPALIIGHGDIAVREDEDERVHEGVDVAEHADDAGPLEAHGLGLADGVAPEIELLGLRERKHVVVDEIFVRESDLRALHHHQKARVELLVLLSHRRALGRLGRLAFEQGGDGEDVMALARGEKDNIGIIKTVLMDRIREVV